MCHDQAGVEGRVGVGQAAVVMGQVVVDGQQVAADLEGNRRKSVSLKSYVALSLSLHSLTSC